MREKGRQSGKHRFRLLAGLLAAALLALCLAGCGGGEQQKKKPQVSLVVKVPTLSMNCITNDKVEDAPSFLTLAAEKFTAAYDQADVSIKVEVFDYVDENAAIVGAYDTPDAADVLYEGYFNMAAYVSGGRVVPLDDIITEDIRADISDATWAQSSKNGKTYMMPFLAIQNIMIYNRDLFLQCGLERFISGEGEIQNWTLEEWDTILDTLAEKLPEGYYPTFMYGANNQGDTHIMTLIRACGSTIFDENGRFSFSSPEGVQGLKRIQDGVARGWYPLHSENLEMMNNFEIFDTGRMGVFTFNNASFYATAMDHYGFVNFPGNLASSFITGFEVFDNGDADKVQVAKAFVKFIYETDELLELSAGNIPESHRVAEKYADDIVMLSQFVANSENVVDFMNSSPNWQGNESSVRSVFWPKIHDLLAGRLTPEECAAALDRDCNAAISVESSYHQ